MGARSGRSCVLEGADGGGTGRRRGREDEDGPSAEAGGAETGPPAKMLRSPPHGGDGGDGLGEPCRKTEGVRSGGGVVGRWGRGGTGPRRAFRREVGVNSEGACP